MNENEAYDQIARRFFAEFLALKVDLDLGQREKPVNYEKQLAGYRKANEQLRGAAADLAAENEKLEEALTIAEEREQEIRRQLNAALMSLGALKEKLRVLQPDRARQDGYSFREHLNEESRKVFDSLMREIPRPGHG